MPHACCGPANPGSTHFWSQAKFQSTNGCWLRLQSRLQSRLGRSHWRQIRVESRLEVNRANYAVTMHTSQGGHTAMSEIMLNYE